jgi:hypothetical protein
VVSGGLLLPLSAASAQEGIFANLQKSVDSTFASVSTTTTDASGTVTKTETLSFVPRLTLRLDSLVSPTLRLNAGAVLEANKAYSDIFSPGGARSETDSTISRFRPFVELRSIDAIFAPGVGFYRREDRARTAGFAGTRLVNDDYAAYLGWRPVGGPGTDFQFVRTNTFDDEKAFLDTSKDFGTIMSRYSWQNLATYYRGTYIGTNDRIRGLDTRQTTHAARTSYSQAFIDRRALWNGSYEIENRSLEVRATGESGEVEIPLRVNGGLSALSDLPVTTALTPNPLLVDGNLTAGAGVNLGLPAPGTNAQARNLGVDFLNRTEVDRLLVWVDRELPLEIARTFSFEVYSSPDNLAWRREALVSTAPFGPFETRFQVDFPAVTARYVKVVVRPLAAVVPDSSRYPDILVTELQPFLRRPAGEIQDRLDRTTHVVNTDWRVRVLDRAGLAYEGYYLYNGPDTFGRSRDTLSNGLAVNHAFNRFVAVYGRGAYERGSQHEGERVATITNATLTFTPVPTFRSSVLYTGQDERIGELPNDRQGLFVQNAAQVYRGVDVLFGIGWNQSTRETGETTRDRLANVSATIAPRDDLSLTVSYDATRSRRSGVFVGEADADTQRAYVALAVDPLRTLHVVLAEEVIAVTGQKTRTTHEVNVNWAPFPDGALQVVFAYDEALRDLVFGQDRNIVGAVRWNLSRRSYIDVSYQRTRSEFVVQTTASRILSSDVRLYF